MLLTEQEIEQVAENARRSFRRYQSGVRGQIVTPWDDPDYHMILATEKAVLAKIKAQGQSAWLHNHRTDSDVVTNAVKSVWGKAAVGWLAAYSIPLYKLPEGD